MPADFIIKQGDVIPWITGSLTGSDGQLIDLDDKTVWLRLSRIHNSCFEEVFTKEAEKLESTGQVKYQWEEGETDEAGIFYGEWIIRYVEDQFQRVPVDSYFTIQIYPRLPGTEPPA